MVEHINENNFDEKVTNAKGVVVVDFFAQWCGPCKMLAPAIEELAENKKDIAVYKVNVDENNSLAIKFRVMSIPTIIVFKDGEKVNQVVGLVSKDELFELANV